MVGDSCAPILCDIRAHSSLRLVLSRRGVGSFGAAMLSDLIVNAPVHLTLELDHNFLGPVGLHVLLHRMTESSVREFHLSVSQNGLDDDSIAVVMGHFRNAPLLRKLTFDVGNNDLHGGFLGSRQRNLPMVGPRVISEMMVPFALQSPSTLWSIHFILKGNNRLLLVPKPMVPRPPGCLIVWDY